MNFEIIRCKAPHNERNVTVRQGRNTWQIDPQALIQAATGVTISRAYCIVSFADGLAEESGQVLMTKGQGWGWQAGTEHHHRRSSFILVYYLLGRAWAYQPVG